MKRRSFEAYLDNPREHRAADAEEEAFTSLMRDLEHLETPDPGANYWNQFNRDFQTRLKGVTPKKKRSWWLHPGFLSFAAMLFLAAVLVPFSLKEKPAAPQTDSMLSLEQLSLEGLAVIDTLYLDENDVVEVAIDTDALLNSYETLYEDSTIDLEGLDAETLDGLFDMEG